MRRIPTELEVKQVRKARHCVQFVLWTVDVILWLVMVTVVGEHLHLPLGHAVVLLVLLGITIAVRRLVTRNYHVWAVSAFLAPIILFVGLYLVMVGVAALID